MMMFPSADAANDFDLFCSEQWANRANQTIDSNNEMEKSWNRFVRRTEDVNEFINENSY